MATVQKIRDSQRASGAATILAIGTANPSNVIYQAEYPDFYFRVANCEHMVDLKNKFKRICMLTFYLFLQVMPFTLLVFNYILSYWIVIILFVKLYLPILYEN